MMVILKRVKRDDGMRVGTVRRKLLFFLGECQVTNVKGMTELEKSALSNISIIIDSDTDQKCF